MKKYLKWELRVYRSGSVKEYNKNAVRGKSNLLTAFFGCRVLETNYWQQFFSGIRTVYQIDLKRKIWMKKKKV